MTDEYLNIEEGNAEKKKVEEKEEKAVDTIEEMD